MQTQPQHILADDDANADGNQFLTFMLNSEEYAVEILRVQGIQGWERVTPIPNSPQYVLGVMNLRGAIVPIIDLRQRFAMESIPHGPTTVIIVVRMENEDRERIIGMVVDAVSEVYRVQPSAIQPLPEMSSDTNTAFIKGVSSVEDKMLIFLDVDKLIGPEPLTDED